MLEKDLQKKCLEWTRKQAKEGKPILAINQHGSAFATRGVADVLLCINGQFVAIELKVGTNKPTELQLSFIEKVKKANGKGFIVYSLEEFKKIVQNLLTSD